MKTISGVSKLESSLQSSVVTIGNFDSIHLGHQALIGKTVELSKKHKSSAVVMSFRPHPVKVLFPEREIHRLFSYEDQADQLENLGIELFVQQPFSRELSELSAERFLSELILKPLNPKAIVVGYDFAFGANREGSIQYLEKYCEKNSIELFVQSPVRVDGEIVSSSLLRDLIANGKVMFAKKCLDRYFYLQGVVEKGVGRGRKIGFPTANVFTKAETFPSAGVYASFTRVNGIRYKSVTNVGSNPTFEDETKRKIQVETHILDFDEDIYGDTIKVEFIKFLRLEMKFSGVEQLVSQINKDVQEARGVHDEVGLD